jgi:hypothetical protein
VALLVGSEVVYLAGRGARAATLTPYDVCAVRLDGTALAGDLPADAERYVSAFRQHPRERVAAFTPSGLVTASSPVALVERISGSPWSKVESLARGAGALVGAYPTDG